MKLIPGADIHLKNDLDPLLVEVRYLAYANALTDTNMPEFATSGYTSTHATRTLHTLR
jgi:hypothetical protein